MAWHLGNRGLLMPLLRKRDDWLQARAAFASPLLSGEVGFRLSPTMLPFERAKWCPDSGHPFTSPSAPRLDRVWDVSAVPKRHVERQFLPEADIQRSPTGIADDGERAGNGLTAFGRPSL